MHQGPLTEAIITAFEGMSTQLQAAARYVLDHPSDVALLSMREQARQAGVQPATMTRFAKHLGLDGYDAIRNLYAEAMRSGDAGFAGKAGAQALSQRLKGDHALAAEMLQSIGGQIARLAEPRSLDRIVNAAATLAKARRIYCLGLRASHAVAWHLHYILTLIGDKTTMLDGIAGTGADAIGTATPDDVLLVASVLPYTRATIEVAEYARHRGVNVVAITDSEVAPLAQFATATILVSTEGPSFFHTMSPAFAVAEVLGALLAGHGGEEAVEALRRFDEQLASFNVHIKPRNSKRQP
ncbi:MurR/RpiR family transcriptional regulator [Rhizobium sp. NZLR1]|uniref:MurR/RpiR family transcriptional regulator n=1 Tax=Rhizobium sp. NZLR1 TaxID=2731096 RepID=UPI001A9A011B|nr:MurR/RpiR family transcriptional regulator [Rhizobium sp. NZLR1]MBX5204122.1 MurR/RpiR family transcriptional regulator [Rhizobium sp. NZLR1]QSZ25087.1 MurR/RpiR family transcriptional regulator [Rhizobium sp. NZLR1]